LGGPERRAKGEMPIAPPMIRRAPASMSRDKPRASMNLHPISARSPDRADATRLRAKSHTRAVRQPGRIKLTAR